MWILDANIPVRYFTKDDPTKATACEALFQRIADSTETVRLCESVVAEVVWVLSNRKTHGVGREDICQLLTTVMRLPEVKLSNKRRCLRVLELHTLYSKLDFADAVVAAFAEAEAAGEVYSDNGDFDRVPSITRLEP